LPSAGIQRREVDPADAGREELVAGERLELYRRLVQESPADIKALVESGRKEWNETLLALIDPAVARDGREKCANAFGEDLGACDVALDTVIERTGEAEGKIVYTRSSVEDGALHPMECRAFLSCHAQLHMGRTVPMPPGEDVVAIRQTTKLKPGAPMTRDDDLEAARRNIPIFEDLLREVMEIPPSERAPYHDYQVAMLRKYLEYFRQRAKKEED